MVDLVPVDHDPFEGIQFAPVDHDPFAKFKRGDLTQGQSIANDVTPMQPQPVSDPLQSTIDAATRIAGRLGS